MECLEIDLWGNVIAGNGNVMVEKNVTFVWMPVLNSCGHISRWFLQQNREKNMILDTYWCQKRFPQSHQKERTPPNSQTSSFWFFFVLYLFGEDFNWQQIPRTEFRPSLNVGPFPVGTPGGIPGANAKTWLGKRKDWKDLLWFTVPAMVKPPHGMWRSRQVLKCRGPGRSSRHWLHVAINWQADCILIFQWHDETQVRCRHFVDGIMDQQPGRIATPKLDTLW